MAIRERPQSRPRSTKDQRLTRAAILTLTAVQILFFVYLVTFGWQFRTLMLASGDPEIAVRTRTVLANGIWLCINVIAVAIYFVRRTRTARYALGAALALDLMNSVLAGLGFLSHGDSTTAIQWWLAGTIPLAALGLLARPAPHQAPRPAGRDT